MKQELANYILQLRDAADQTHRAEDRPIYQSLLADAAVLLALVETDTEENIIADAVMSHERLWGHIWLQDPVFNKTSSAWGKFKNTLSSD